MAIALCRYRKAEKKTNKVREWVVVNPFFVTVFAITMAIFSVLLLRQNCKRN